SSIVMRFVGGLSKTGESDDNNACTNAGVVDDILSVHSANHGAVDDDGANHITHIGGFATGAGDVQSIVPEQVEKSFRPLDDRGDHFAGDVILVSANGRRQQNILCCTDTEQVVHIHDDCILCDAFPYGQIACLLPVDVRERRFGSGAVGMHHGAEVRVVSQVIRHDLAKGFRKKALV